MLKKITFSADEKLIRMACAKAKQENTTLNVKFRQWLNKYVYSNTKALDYESFMESINYAEPGRHFSREEMRKYVT